MEVTINELSKNQKEIKIIIPPEKIEEYGDKAVEIISSETKIDGFRPGKAPRVIVEEKVGKERVWQESCYLALRETYPKIIEEKNFLIVSSPEVKIESMEIRKPLKYSVIVTTFPDVNLPEYHKISQEIVKEKKEITVDEKETENALNTIQKSRAKTKAVSRSSQEGDEVVITFQGSIDGIDQEALKGEKRSFILGEQKFVEGFDENLINLKQGETKKFSTEIKTHQKENKKIDFEVEVNDVREREIPELNDEFASSLGNFLNLEDLREKVKNNIKFEKELKEKERIRVKIIENITDKSETEIPETMIEKELDNMIIEFKNQLSQSGISFENYLKEIKKTEPEIRKEWNQRSEKRVKSGLILQKIAEKEKIEISDQEVEQETNNYLNRLREQKIEPPDHEKLKLYFKDLIQNEKVFQLLENKTQ